MPTDLHLPTEIDLAQFISKEAHDLKSPFTRVLGFVKLVLKGMDGPISDQAKEDLTISYQNSQYALLLISSLVEMARLSRGERGASLAEVPLEPTLRQVIADWKKQSPKEYSVEITLAAAECTLNTDLMLLRQLVSNWIFYVTEFVQQEVSVNIQAIDDDLACTFTIRSQGKKLRPPAECDLTLYGYIANQVLGLLGGSLRRLLEDEQGVIVEFSLNKG